MSKNVIDAELRITGTSNTGKVFDQMVKDAKRGTDALKKAADYDAIVARIKPLTTALDGAAKASAKTGGQLAQDAARISKEYGQLKGVLDLSAPLKAQLAQMRLNRAEIGALVKDAHRMTRERDQALSGIGNAKVRAQVMAADTNNIERQLRERARVMRMEADLTREIATRAARSQAHVSGRLYLDPADTRAFRERTTFSNRMERQRAALEKSEQADQRAADARAIMDGRRQIAFATRIAKQRQAEERALAAQELRAAREASRAAVAAEKAAAREASQAAREAAQAKREAARERMQAAREAARSAREAARVEAAAIREAARETARVERDARRRERSQHAYEHRLGHLGRDVMIGAGLGYGAHRVGHLVKEGLHEGRLSATEDVKEQFQGFTPEQIEETRHKALDLSARFPSVSALKIREYQRKATSVTGSYHHAEDLMEDMVRARVMLGVGGKGEEGERDVETIVQAAEGLNRASSAAVLRPMLNAFVRAKALYGETVRADTFRDYTKQAGTSVVGLDDSYLTTVVPAMLQENAQWGVAQMTALGQMSRPVQKKAQIKALGSAGLLDKQHMLVGRTLARKNPYEYANTVLTSALQRAGIDLDKARDFTNPEGQTHRLAVGDKLASWFPDRKASLFWEKQILDKTKIDRNAAQSKNVTGLEGAETALRQDPGTGFEALKSQVENLASVASSPLVKAAAPALAELASGIAQFTQTLQKHPEGTKQAVGAAAVIGGATLPFIVGHSMKALAGDNSGIAASALRLGGGALTGLGLPMLALGGMGAFAGYATSQEYEKTFKERGPAGFDPATGSTVDGNPMAGLGPDHPWVREAIQGWWSKTMPTWAGGGEEAGKQIGETIGKAIVDAPLPPRRPAMLDDFKGKADETGSEAGKTLLQRIIESVGAGINIPINFVPGDGGGMGGGGSGIQKASFGGGGGSFAGLVQRASVGGGGSLGGGATFGGGSRGGGSGSGPTGPIPGIPASVDMTDAERNMLGLIQLHESHGRNTLNYVGTRQGLDPMTARGATAQGYFQILNSNWRRLAPGLGIKTRNAMSSTLEEQTRVALALLRASGGRPKDWAPFNPALRAAIARGDRAPDGGTTAERAAAAEPRLVKGLDGKEGLDLGNGTMKMPDGSIRSITSGVSRIPNVPDMPPAGTGARGAGEIGGHVAEFGRHVDRLQDMNFHGRVDVALTGGGGRVTGLRAKGRGMTADMGISEPGAKDDDSDWS